jgi:hypothetical protein
MKTICILSGIILLLGIPAGWPYAYYVLLRIIIFISSIVVAYKFYKKSLTFWTFVFGAIAFLFNPIIPVYLSKAGWIPIDFIVAIIFFYAALSKDKQIHEIK